MLPILYKTVTTELAAARNLPEGASLFVLDGNATPPWWKEYFSVEQDLWQAHKGALVFLPVGDRCFALSFGQVFHHLDDASYEYDFGLRVTLNAVDPDELKSADMVAPGHGRRKRTQVPISTELTYLDFDGNSEIIKSLTGKVRPEYAELFKTATGSAALKISLKLKPAELVGRCCNLLKLYNRDDYKQNFPNIQNITPIRDRSITGELDAKLLKSLKQESEHVSLAIPDIIDYRDNTCCIFRGMGRASKIYPDISLEQFYEFLKEVKRLNELSIDDLRSLRLELTDVDGRSTRSYSIYKALYCDARISDNLNHIICATGVGTR